MIFVENVLLEFWNVHKIVCRNQPSISVWMINFLLKFIKIWVTKYNILKQILILSHIKKDYLSFFVSFHKEMLHHFQYSHFSSDGVKGEVDERRPVYMTNNSRQNQLLKYHSSEHSTITDFFFASGFVCIRVLFPSQVSV